MAEVQVDTENKIKEAARRVFHQKGFAGAKTRDIAEEAGINLALLNYYFRSKKKLFDLIMTETMHAFLSGLLVVLNNEKTTLLEKVSLVAEHYIDLLTENPNVAHFILNTVRENPDDFFAKVGLLEKAQKSVFVNQFMDGVMKGEVPPINPIHFIMNVMGLIVFPFMAQPMIAVVTGIPNENLTEIIQERKRLIPLWITAMLTVK